MIKVFTEAHNIISPIGSTTAENFNNILSGETGINICRDKQFSSTAFPASTLNRNDVITQFSALGNPDNFTRFEMLAIMSIHNALSHSNVSATDPRTLLIISTTKGNIELLDKNTPQQFSNERLYLDATAQIIGRHFNFKLKPIVVSNACISGVAAIILAQRLIKQGIYDHVIVNGTEILSRFIVSGFQSFLALSDMACKPFDANRNGLTLGEGSATLVLSKTPSKIEVANGAISNDANHISGPSRTGEGLIISIQRALYEFKKPDLISAHGTATRYNDDMESVAIARAGLTRTPVNSLKGYYGHTLGAAGVLESIVNIESMQRNIIISTKGCDTPGTTEELNVTHCTQPHNIDSMLKLASGFGGCNAAVLFVKHE